MQNCARRSWGRSWMLCIFYWKKVGRRKAFGKSLLVAFIGDRNQILNETTRELSGQPFSGEEFSMTVAVLDDYKLNPDDAVSITMTDLCAIMGRTPVPEDLPEEPVYVPRIPLDAK